VVDERTAADRRAGVAPWQGLGRSAAHPRRRTDPRSRPTEAEPRAAGRAGVRTAGGRTGRGGAAEARRPARQGAAHGRRVAWALAAPPQPPLRQ
jgi:hypothetical protein